jgi:fluoroquinolone transport system ATP-binding protein
MVTDDGSPVVRVEDLEYAYPGAEDQAVRGISFAIDRGEILGFLGPSGAGKSTTQNVLTGLLDDYGGHVEVFGREMADWGGDFYERVGVSAESPNHYRKLTGRENLRLFASLYEGETADPARLLERVGLLAAADRPVDEYSKGMAMRLNLVRSLLHAPELLFLHEPPTGLDPSNARSVRDLVRERRRDGTTVFLTTHDMAVADDLCDRVAFIVDGRLVAVDDPAALKRRHGEPRVRVEYRENGAVETAEFDLPTVGADDGFRDLLATRDVESIHSADATLEDVFIDVTGRQLA